MGVLGLGWEEEERGDLRRTPEESRFEKKAKKAGMGERSRVDGVVGEDSVWPGHLLKAANPTDAQRHADPQLPGRRRPIINLFTVTQAVRGTLTTAFPHFLQPTVIHNRVCTNREYSGHNRGESHPWFPALPSASHVSSCVTSFPTCVDSPIRVLRRMDPIPPHSNPRPTPSNISISVFGVFTWWMSTPACPAKGRAGDYAALDVAP